MGKKGLGGSKVGADVSWGCERGTAPAGSCLEAAAAAAGAKELSRSCITEETKSTAAAAAEADECACGTHSLVHPFVRIDFTDAGAAAVTSSAVTAAAAVYGD